MRMLAYGTAADAQDEYCRISESTSLESLKRFCAAIVKVYSKKYLRQPTWADIQKQMDINEKRGIFMH